MKYTVELSGFRSGLFVHCYRDIVNMPCAQIAGDVARAVESRGGLSGARVMGVRRQETFDVPVAQGRE